MIIYGISFLVGGMILLIFSTLLCFGFVDLLHDCYNKEIFQSKTNLLMSMFIDKAVQGMRVA